MELSIESIYKSPVCSLCKPGSVYNGEKKQKEIQREHRLIINNVKFVRKTHK